VLNLKLHPGEEPTPTSWSAPMGSQWRWKGNSQGGSVQTHKWGRPQLWKSTV